MIEKLNKRKQHEFDAIKGKDAGHLTSDSELFSRLGNKIKRIKK